METKFIESTLLNQNEINRISSYIQFGQGIRIRHLDKYKALENQAGLYAFWIDNEDGFIRKLNRDLIIKGPNDISTPVEWNWGLNSNWILSYVGRSTSLRKRISKHLMLRTNDWYKKTVEMNGTLFKPTTTCQLRSGIEHLLINVKMDSLEFMNDRIGLTVVKSESFVDRFYHEDLAIGIGKPWFNVDSER